MTKNPSRWALKSSTAFAPREQGRDTKAGPLLGDTRPFHSRLWLEVFLAALWAPLDGRAGWDPCTQPSFLLSTTQDQTCMEF